MNKSAIGFLALLFVLTFVHGANDCISTNQTLRVVLTSNGIRVPNADIYLTYTSTNGKQRVMHVITGTNGEHTFKLMDVSACTITIDVDLFGMKRSNRYDISKISDNNIVIDLTPYTVPITVSVREDGAPAKGVIYVENKTMPFNYTFTLIVPKSIYIKAAVVTEDQAKAYIEGKFKEAQTMEYNIETIPVEVEVKNEFGESIVANVEIDNINTTINGTKTFKLQMGTHEINVWANGKERKHTIRLDEPITIEDVFDTTPPYIQIIDITMTNESTALTLKVTDKGEYASGASYAVITNGADEKTITLKDGKEETVELSGTGRKINITAYDNEGNYRTATISIEISKLTSDKNETGVEEKGEIKERSTISKEIKEIIAIVAVGVASLLILKIVIDWLKENNII